MDDVICAAGVLPWNPEPRLDGSVEIGVNHCDTISGRVQFESVSPERYLDLWDKGVLKFQ